MNFQHLSIPNYENMLVKILGDIHYITSSDQTLFYHLIFPFKFALIGKKAKTLQNSKDAIYWTLNGSFYEKKILQMK